MKDTPFSTGAELFVVETCWTLINARVSDRGPQVQCVFALLSLSRLRFQLASCRKMMTNTSTAIAMDMHVMNILLKY